MELAGTYTNARRILSLAVWAGALGGALSIASAPGNWGHGLCGPWGCGPPLQALVACHLAWLVVLAPPTIWLRRSARISVQRHRQIGWLTVLAAALMLLATVVHEAVVWLPKVSESHQGYFWQRCGFVIATTIDLPMVELLMVGLYLALWRTSEANHGLHG